MREGGLTAAPMENATRDHVTSPVWREVYETLQHAGPDALDRDDLDRLGEAAFWLGQPRDAIFARQRAYVLHRESGDIEKAARAAWLLFYDHFNLDETPVASGWLKRAQRHAADMPGSVHEGYVAVAEADWALFAGKPGDAESHARRAVENGRSHNDRDLVALGQATQGRILVHEARVADGLGMLDDAMVAAVSDELSPFITGWIYCLLLLACHEVGDVRRAAQWTETALSWSEEHGQDSWYPGICRLHRCEVQSLRGDWSTAEEEALRTSEELTPFGDYLVAESQYLVGEIRLRRGDLEGANDAFRRAHELGSDSQPGLALLRLAQGDAEGAAGMLRVALAGGSGGGPMRRGRLLAAHVEAELRDGNLEDAKGSAGKLAELADANGVLMLRGMAAKAQGAVLLAEEDTDAALPFLREAQTICRELSCPYETADTRLLLGLAARRAGDEETAQLEFEAALSTFERLGAKSDVERAAALVARKPRSPRGLTRRQVEVLGLVALGKTNRQIAEALFISEHTVARHLSNIFHKLDVTSRSAATAFAVEHDLA